MSSQSNGGNDPTNVGSNTYNFSTGGGSVDPNSGLNSLNVGLVGANAGTLPNGYTGGSGNYTPDSSASGISSSSLNGNVSFGMPGSSVDQLNSQALTNGQATNLSNALGLGAKINTPQSGSRPQSMGSGRISERRVQFANPIQNFAGSVSGSDAGNSLLKLLANFHPGVIGQ